jgi:hypothetical protein
MNAWKNVSATRRLDRRVLLDQHAGHLEPGPRASAPIIVANHRMIRIITGMATAKANK